MTESFLPQELGKRRWSRGHKKLYPIDANLITQNSYGTIMKALHILKRALSFLHSKGRRRKKKQEGVVQPIKSAKSK